MLETPNTRYFKLWYRLNAEDAYLIWFTGRCDGVVVTEGHIVAFSEVRRLEEYAEVHAIPITSEPPILHNLDVIQQWLQNPKGIMIDCKECINAWNLFDDISTSLDTSFAPDNARLPLLYDNLFASMNLPAMTNEGTSYQPLWSEEEVKLLIEVLSLGLTLFRQHLRFVTI